MSKKAKTTVVSFLLDETGSMESIRDDTIGGFNSYLDTLQGDGNEYEFTLVKFDSNRTDKVCVGSPIKGVARLDRNTYCPGAATPLIDAAVKLIQATEKVVDERDVNVLVALQTDGHENASTEYERDDLTRLVKEKTDQGWTFVYLGAGIDAFADAQSFGIAAAQTMSYDRAQSGATFRSMAENTAFYAKTGASASMAFTGAQRSEAGDTHHGKHTGAPAGKVAIRQKREAVKKAKRESVVEDIDLTH